VLDKSQFYARNKVKPNRIVFRIIDTTRGLRTCARRTSTPDRIASTDLPAIQRDKSLRC
jgi:hypothetical protein